MPVFARCIIPVAALFLLSVLLKAPDKLIITTFIVCVTGLIGVTIRAFIIAKHTRTLKPHQREQKNKIYYK